MENEECKCGSGPGYVLMDCEDCGDPICSNCEAEHKGRGECDVEDDG